MKTLKNLFFVLFIGLATVTFTSCGDKSEDPTPVTPKTDLEIGKLAFTNKTLDSESGVVNGTLVTDLCTTGTFKESVQDIKLTFKPNSVLVYTDMCISPNEPYNDFSWEMNDLGNGSLNLRIRTRQGALVINTTFKISDVLTSDNNLKSQIELVFDELSSPLNWKLSPKITFKVS